MKTEHTLEPWSRDAHGATRNKNDLLIAPAGCLLKVDQARMEICVNACAGMEDPAAEIEALREALKQIAERVRLSSGGTIPLLGRHECAALALKVLDYGRTTTDSQTLKPSA